MLAYSDEAEAIMPEDDKPMRITRITLRPRIVVAEGVDHERVVKLVGRAHESCFVANSLNSEMVIEPVIETG